MAPQHHWGSLAGISQSGSVVEVTGENRMEPTLDGFAGVYDATAANFTGGRRGSGSGSGSGGSSTVKHC
jgi:hypothetical protein